METIWSLHIQVWFGTTLYAEDDFQDVRITLGGDQLTKVCFDSAKNLRAGTHTATDRLEQLSPVIEELFHVEQDLLEKIIKTFYKTESSREDGTSPHFRTLLGRRNVKYFVVTVTRALTVELACEKIGLVNKLRQYIIARKFKILEKSQRKTMTGESGRTCCG